MIESVFSILGDHLRERQKLAAGDQIEGRTRELPDEKTVFTPEGHTLDSVCLLPCHYMYICGIHRKPLVKSGQQAICSECYTPYEIRDGIWLLDRAQRWDASEFDAQVHANPVQLDLSTAQRHLEAAGISGLDNAVILDVGCGLGDLTLGLAQSQNIVNSEVYAFDHSIESLRLAASAICDQNSNRVHFSAQDVSNLYFADEFFDVIIGSAILHHVLNYSGFLVEMFRVLKPGGLAIFSEPFFNGYFWPCLLLRNAIEDLDLDIDAPEFGQCRFIINYVSFVAHHQHDLAVLDKLTDKHLFRDDTISDAAYNAKFRSVTLLHVEPAEFYAGWITHFMDTFGIRHRELRRAAERQYSRLRTIAGPFLRELVSHFKYIVLRK